MALLLNGKTSATQHICNVVNSAPIQSPQLNPELAFFSAKFTGSKSKYGSVEPPNAIRVAELILCDVFNMALLSRSPLLPIAVGNAGLPYIRRTEIVMPKGNFTPEGEVIAAYGAAMVASFQVLINCLEESDALLPGQFPDALRIYMEM